MQNDPERIVRARRALKKVVERLANREVPLMRADRLRPDEAGVWHLDRIVLLRGTPNLGRITGAAITYSSKAREVIEWFLVLAGANWTSVPMEEATARAFSDELAGAHRVGTFNGFGKLLRATACKSMCSECGALVTIEFIPIFAAPSIPSTMAEFQEAVARMRRGPPMITHRTSLRAA